MFEREALEFQYYLFLTSPTLECTLKIYDEKLTRASRSNTGTKSLHKLDLGSNAITDVGASKISQALSSCALQSLNLSGNSIKDDGATSLATALKQSSSVVLRTLHLERNPFTSSGCREIAKMARVNLSLKHLSFAHYVLDDSALQSLRVAFDFF